jgi:hypothetical protein
LIEAEKTAEEFHWLSPTLLRSDVRFLGRIAVGDSKPRSHPM